MSRTILAALALALSTVAGAGAQVIFPGSTRAGDDRCGVGIAAAGMGVHNVDTSVAVSINTDTAIRWNERVRFGHRPLPESADCIPEWHLCVSSDSHQCFPFCVYDEDGTNRRENITVWDP